MQLASDILRGTHISQTVTISNTLSILRGRSAVTSMTDSALFNQTETMIQPGEHCVQQVAQGPGLVFTTTSSVNSRDCLNVQQAAILTLWTS